MDQAGPTNEEPEPLLQSKWGRRAFLLAAGSGLLGWGAACGDPGTDNASSATESCHQTPGDIEGPYWRPGSPERTDLDLYGDAGTPLLISGHVLDADCQPIPQTVVEIWHGFPTTVSVDELSPVEDVEYDNTSDEMRYRGYTVTGPDGRFSFRTLKPGWYQALGAYRPAHIHFKVWKDDVELLTTQMYFVGDPFLSQDPWALEDLAIPLESVGDDAESARFDLLLPSLTQSQRDSH